MFDPGFRIHDYRLPLDFGFMYRVKGSGLRARGSGFRVQGSGFRVSRVKG